ncbi:DUF3857 domain-containing protein [Flavobacterium lindanitolerans]|nr:DUF3857 domain-containing protein [Flavobacterium lindanitolerans]
MNSKFRIKAIYVFLILFSLNAFAQDFSFKNYNWDEKSAKIDIPSKYKEEKEAILERNTKIELLIDKGKAIQYYLIHEKRYINSDDAVERNNKIYIPFGANESVVSTKARVILKNGKVIELHNSDIKEETDEERGIKYKYFAVNGLEKGAVIEKIFIIEEFPEVKGYTVKMQDEYPIVKSTFQLIYPEHLIFRTKSYNGLSEAVVEKSNLMKKATL